MFWQGGKSRNWFQHSAPKRNLVLPRPRRSSTKDYQHITSIRSSIYLSIPPNLSDSIQSKIYLYSLNLPESIPIYECIYHLSSSSDFRPSRAPNEPWGAKLLHREHFAKQCHDAWGPKKNPPGALGLPVLSHGFAVYKSQIISWMFDFLLLLQSSKLRWMPYVLQTCLRDGPCKKRSFQTHHANFDTDLANPGGLTKYCAINASPA